MADEIKKISELNEALSIAGIDVLPIVQDGETKKVSVDMLGAGKSDTDHSHNLADLVEKSYNSLEDKPDLDLKVDKVSGSSLVEDTKITSYDNHLTNATNPHSVTKTQIGLSNVDNTSDVNKPVSSATQTALNTKANSSEVYTKTQIDTLTLDYYTEAEINQFLSDYSTTSQTATLLETKADLENGKVKLSQLPDSVLGQVEYKGTWNASTNTPDLTTVLPSGKYYITSVAGTFNSVAFEIGDWILSNGITWDKVDNTDAVSSVNGMTGNVVITKNTISLGNVDNTSDASKPISTATQTALNNKANTATTLSGYGITDAISSTASQTAKYVLIAPNSANGSPTFRALIESDLPTLAISKISGLQEVLDGKVDDSQVLTNVPLGALFTDTVYTHPTTDGNKHLPSGGASGQYVKWSSAGTGSWDTINMEDMPTSSYKSSCRVATTANITLSGTQTIDGIAVIAGDRVLVKEQTLPQENGIYVVNASTWTRALDADTSSEIAVGIVNVDSGTVNGGFTFKTRFKATDALGTTAMNWFNFMSVDTAPIAGGFDTSATTPTATNRLNYNGYLYPTAINLVGMADTTGAATHYFCENATDGFIRPKTLSNVQAELVTFASVYNAKKTWFTSGVGTAGITGATNYALFPAAQDTLTLGVGTYEIEMVAYVTVATSTVSGSLQLSPRGAGTAVGTVYGMSTGAITQNGTPIQTGFGSTALGTALTVTAASAVAGRVYSAQFKGIMNITTTGTIIPSYLFSATLTSGVTTLNALNHMKIKQIAATSVTTAGGWV